MFNLLLIKTVQTISTENSFIEKQELTVLFSIIIEDLVGADKLLAGENWAKKSHRCQEKIRHLTMQTTTLWSQIRWKRI